VEGFTVNLRCPTYESLCFKEPDIKICSSCDFFLTEESCKQNGGCNWYQPELKCQSKNDNKSCSNDFGDLTDKDSSFITNLVFQYPGCRLCADKTVVPYTEKCECTTFFKKDETKCCEDDENCIEFDLIGYKIKSDEGLPTSCEEINETDNTASKKSGSSKQKKKKTKKLTQAEIDELKKLYTKTLMETLEIYDISIPLNSFLNGEKYIENEYTLNPLVNEDILKRVETSQTGDKKKGKGSKKNNKSTDGKGKDKKKSNSSKDCKESEENENINLLKKISLSIKLN